MNDQKRKRKKYVRAVFISYQSLCYMHAFADVGQSVRNDKHSFFAFGVSTGSYARCQISIQSGKATTKAMNGS